jgi:hypothetical protein
MVDRACHICVKGYLCIECRYLPSQSRGHPYRTGMPEQAAILTLISAQVLAGDSVKMAYAVFEAILKSSLLISLPYSIAAMSKKMGVREG